LADNTDDIRVFEYVLKSDNSNLIKHIARNPQCPRNILNQILDIKYNDTSIMLYLLDNPKLPPEILYKLKNHEIIDVRNKATSS
jgi:hypothetical protein